MSRDKLVDVNDPYHASVNLGCQGKSGPGKIHEVIHVHNIHITGLRDQKRLCKLATQSSEVLIQFLGAKTLTQSTNIC